MPTITPQPRTARPPDWHHYSQLEVAEVFGAQLRELRARYTELLETLGELSRRESAAGRQVADLLRESWRLSGSQIKKLMAHVAALQSRPNVAGEPLPALLPATRDALAAGAISDEHVTAIANVFRHCPTGVATENRAATEAKLVAIARTSTPGVLRHRGTQVVASWNGEEKPRGTGPAASARELVYWRRRRDGAVAFRGWLDPESGSTLAKLVDSLSKPLPGRDGRKDTATRAQRNGDALAEIVDTANRADDMTIPGGTPATPTAAIALHDVKGLGAIRRMACEGKLVTAALDAGVSGPEGRSREARGARERALASRDEGCTFPGCTRRPKWCFAHKVVRAQNTDAGDHDNLVLLCGKHHRYIHEDEWEVRFNVRDGLPEFLPPANVDPKRRPLRNHVHSPHKPLEQRCRKQPARRRNSRRRGSSKSRARSRGRT